MTNEARIPRRIKIVIRLMTGLFLLCLHCSVYAQVELVKVDKSKRRMYLIENGQVIRTYRIALGKHPKGHKRQSGDQRTPEGRYILDRINHHSHFYKAFHINYPNQNDRRTANLAGYSPGGGISIHGLKNGNHYPPEFIKSFDWTNGCIAISNQEMDEFIHLVPIGTPIDIQW